MNDNGLEYSKNIRVGVTSITKYPYGTLGFTCHGLTKG
jgi:hypothetical protein